MHPATYLGSSQVQFQKGFLLFLEAKGNQKKVASRWRDIGQVHGSLLRVFEPRGSHVF